MLRPLRTTAVLVVAGLFAFSASAQSHDDDQYGQYGQSGYYDDGQYRPAGYAGSDAPAYDYARVVRVDPIIVGGGQGRGERCYERNGGDYVYGDNGDRYYRGDDRYASNRYGNGGYRNDGYDSSDYGNGRYRQGSEGGRQLATVIGSLAGAVLGSQIGGGDGRYIGTAVGTIAGGAAGRAIYEANNRGPSYRRGDVRVCEPSGYGSESERVDGYDVTYEYAGRQYHTRRDYHPGDRIRVRVDVSAD